METEIEAGKENEFEKLARRVKENAAAKISALEKLNRAVGNDAHLCPSEGWDWHKGILNPAIDLIPDDDLHARRTTGALIRGLGIQPKIQKTSDDAEEAQARFELDGVVIRINRYRGRNCKLVEKEVVIPAEPERVIPAQPQRVEKKLVMECDPVHDEGSAEPFPNENR